MIRRLTEADLPTAAEVIRASFATVAAEFGITRENCPAHTSFITAERLRDHYRGGAEMYGWFNGENMAGYVSLSDQGEGAFSLHNLAVLPEHQHNGYGKRLLDFCKEQVRQSGGIKIQIGIIEEHTVLKDWYAGNGFTHTGTKRFDHLPFVVGYMEWGADHG